MSRYTAGRSLSYFYPRPPRGGRRDTGAIDGVWDLFLSTPSARRATNGANNGVFALNLFLSTPSARRATRKPDCSMGDIPYFYPRPPRGGRPKSCGSSAPRLVFLSTPSARRATTATTSPSPAARFLSTPSARRATLCFRVCDSFVSISIHALREEGDLRYPRPPAHQGISIHALREEGDFVQHG